MSAGKVFKMEPHGVLGCLFNERVILGLICADLDGVISVENLRIHGLLLLLVDYLSFELILNQFLLH
jgi:hypothetical protein